MVELHMVPVFKYRYNAELWMLIFKACCSFSLGRLVYPSFSFSDFSSLSLSLVSIKNTNNKATLSWFNSYQALTTE